ncbi:hypothetical protein QQZ08_005495 [Neonectria magnoliae]|uniref:Nephrocystin 3-like N-terminal domain-containing protein n=1 Tax=Neonectria magnoliae TaxID=2732573 RepID=A0ABR1I3G1_9HYPO
MRFKLLLPQSASSESTLLSISARCIEASDKLQAAINDLQAGKHGKRKISTAANSFAFALKTVWKKSEIEALKKDLLEVRSQIVFTTLISVWEETRQEGQRHGYITDRLDQISQKLDRRDDTARLFAKELAEMTIYDNSSYLTRKNTNLVKIIWGIDCKSWAAVQDAGLFENPKTAKTSEDDRPISIKILSSLSFHGMDARQESIPEAYKTTFNWIFQDEQSNVDGKMLGRPSFPKWLQTKDNSIYWITGKPGSGKSTLMNDAEKSPGTLINWIEDVITRHHIKVCVSSRPWNAFPDAFSKGPSLTMQSLTQRDIQHFVNSEFEKSPAFQDLWDAFDDEAISVLEEITDKADGVFLWVSFVVKSLLLILVDTPSLPHLHEKLADIPNDIIGVYTSIWRLIPPERLATTSKIFQLCRAAIDGLRVEVCWLATEGVSNPNLIKNLKARQGIPKVMKRVLEGHTRGICELSNDEVRFLHRSALEWMRQKTIWAEICSKAPDEFESNLSLLEASIQHILVEQDFQIIHDADLLIRSRKHRVTVVLDEMNKIVCERFMKLIGHEDSNSGSVAESMDQNLEMFPAVNWVAGELSADMMDIELSFVGTAARAGLVGHVKEKVAHDKRLLVPKR